MKNKKLAFVFLLGLSMFLLSACSINVITEIKSDGAGIYIQEIGLPTEELSGMGMDAAAFCDQVGQDLPAGMSSRQETRNGDETWCIFETEFASLDELIALYSQTDTRINQIPQRQVDCQNARQNHRNQRHRTGW